MPKLKELIISITNRCNLKCRMCDIPLQKMDELTTAQWKGVIKDASCVGAQTVVFSGGEPLLREDIFELISFVKDNSMNACITSNGYLINADYASRLSDSGINVVNISIEGPKEIHDYLRGRETFEKAVSALDNLKKHKIESTIAVMVSRHNYKYLRYIVELSNAYGVTTIKFQPFSMLFQDNGRGAEEFFISKREILVMEDKVKEVVQLCNEYCIATNPVNFLERIPFYLGQEDFGTNGSCISLSSSCPINAKGEVFPCWVLAQKEKIIGDVRKNNFTDIWQSARHNAVIEIIEREGCPGCMMSCYDDNFGRDTIKEKAVMNLIKLRKKGPLEYIKHILRRLKKKFKFYATYRGSLRTVLKRLSKKNKRLFKIGIPKTNNEGIEMALGEISSAKEMLERELRCLR